MWKYVIPACDVDGLLEQLNAIRSEAEAKTGRASPFVSIQDAAICSR